MGDSSVEQASSRELSRLAIIHDLSHCNCGRADSAYVPVAGSGVIALTVSLLAVLTVVSCGSSEKLSGSDIVVHDDEAAIYQKVLLDFAAKREVQRLEVQALAEPINRLGLVADHPEWELSLALASESRTDLTGSLPELPGVEVVVLSEAELQRLCGSKDWRQFFERFPHSHGLIKLSAIGFDPSRCRAMVVVSIEAGTFVSSRIAYVLERDGSAWCISEEYWLVMTIG